MSSGGTWTWAQAREAVRVTAGALRAHGVRAGDLVGMWLPNCRAAIRVWWAVNWLGASLVPVNTAYRGAVLEHVLRDSGIRLLVAHPDLIPRLSEVDTTVTAITADGLEASDQPVWDPARAEKDIKVGHFYMDKGDVDAAIDRFEDATVAKPGYALPFLYLGEAHEKKGQKRLAAKAYRRYLDLSPHAEDAAKVQKKIDKLYKELEKDQEKDK